ncbi:MAG: hypothetical protein Q4B01_08385 [Eubacteriales bacterium]|nr:hypothetical protein [Eubacteriales bacterium]
MITGIQITQKILLLLYLAKAAERDIREKRVAVRPAVKMMLLSGGLLILTTAAGRRLLRLGMAALPGMTVLLISGISREAIGKGDALVLLVVGFSLGAGAACEVLAAGVFLSFPAALFVLISKKGDRRTELPFLPFLLAGYLLYLAAEG